MTQQCYDVVREGYAHLPIRVPTDCLPKTGIDPWLVAAIAIAGLLLAALGAWLWIRSRPYEHNLKPPWWQG